MSVTPELIPEYPHPQSTFVHIGRVANGAITLRDTNLNAEQFFSDYVLSTQTAILANPNEIVNLNLDAIDNFRQEMGAPVKPLRFLSEPNYNQAIKLTGKTTTSDTEGYYSLAIGIPIVKRNLMLETLNGPQITESFAIHELAHSSHIDAPIRVEQSTSGKWIFKSVSTEVTQTRSGFALRSPYDSTGSRGKLLEEGYAEFERGLYVQNHNLVDAFTSEASNLDRLRSTTMPLHYLYKTQAEDGQSSLTFAPGAIIATVLELLIQQDKEVLPALRESRRSVDGLRVFAQRVNALVPNIYNQLQSATLDSAIDLCITTQNHLNN